MFLIIRNCEIKSIAPYGAFVEIAPGREVNLNLDLHIFCIHLLQQFLKIIVKIFIYQLDLFCIYGSFSSGSLSY